MDKCIHRFDIKGIFRNTEFRQCSKCNFQHMHSPKCIVIGIFGDKTCRVTKEVLCDKQSHFYEQEQNINKTCGKKKEELTDYMNSIISRISDDGDQMGLRKKLYQYYEERDTNFELNQIILKKPSLVAMVILLDFYKMLTKDKNMSLKKKIENKNKIKIFQCNSLKKRTTMYQISNLSKKKMKHRCIWRVFMEIEKSRKT